GSSGSGVYRYDGAGWHQFSTQDGLPDLLVRAVASDRSGDLWFGAGHGAVRHEPDRVPPQSVISPLPAALSASRTQTFHFAAAFRETDGIEFQYRIGLGPWSAWSPDNFAVLDSLPDGAHEFVVRARDTIGNIDPTPAVV